MQTPDGQITELMLFAGLDYPGVGPMHAHLFRSKRAEFISIPDQDAGLGSDPLPNGRHYPPIETAHAFAALDVRKFSPEEVIVFNCSDEETKI